MSWLASFGIALLTSALGGVSAGCIAYFSIEWFHIASFEGESSYFLVALVLLGLLVGFLVGIIISRISKTWLQSLRRASATILLTGGAILGLARLTGDVPPTLGGEEVNLLLEVRYPATVSIVAAEDPYAHRVILAPLNAIGEESNNRSWARLRPEDIRTEGELRVIPAQLALESRADQRRIHLFVSDKEQTQFLIALPANPTEEQERWSTWADARNGYTYRIRVQRKSATKRSGNRNAKSGQPLRTGHG